MPAGVELLVAGTGEVAGLLERPTDLSAAERARAAAIRDPEGAAEFVAAHLLAREAVRRLTGERVALAQRCPECGADGHGLPAAVGLPQVSVSWSHTRGLVAAVAALVPAGVDVEARTRSHDVRRLLGRTATGAEAAEVLGASDPELAYLRMWCAKEALVKVGALSLAQFGQADVRAGCYAGFALSVCERPDAVVALALQA